METMELMKQRHSVRQFVDKPIEEDVIVALEKEIADCNKESGMNIQLITNEPEAFQAGETSYGQFKGCRNYLVIVGPKGMDEEAGYYGERVVLKALELGLIPAGLHLPIKKEKHREKKILEKKGIL